MQKQRRRSALQFSAFIFATRIVQFLFYLNLIFPASTKPSSVLVQLCLCRTCSETTLLVFSQCGSLLFFSQCGSFESTTVLTKLSLVNGVIAWTPIVGVAAFSVFEYKRSFQSPVKYSNSRLIALRFHFITSL